MDDVIRRQDAIDAFFNATSDGDKAEFCVDVVKNIPSAQQWIPCSERLPEEYVSVLCYQPILYESNIWIGYLNSDRIWVDSDGWEKLTNPVTAWMPLPGPYEDKHED